MTHHPIPENLGNWWLTTWSGWRRLHAVPGGDLTEQQHRDAIDQGEAITRTVACGRRLDLAVPGISSRLGLRRCTPCCRRLGIPVGDGTPANENHREPQER